MKPVIHGVGTGDHPNLCTFEPADAEDVALFLRIGIGVPGSRGTDDFFLLVATPRGLAGLPVHEDGTIATGRIVVIARYDYDAVWRWIERTVAACRADSWEGCLSRLREKLDWEFEGFDKGVRF